MLRVQKVIPGLILTSQTLKLFCRHFHSHHSMLKSFNAKQISVLTQKFLVRNEYYFKKKKKGNIQVKPLDSASSILGSANSTMISRRTKRLNKIFMEKISETLLTSQYATPLMKIGFEITQIKVQEKLASIHVYWYYSQDTDEEELNNILLNLSSHIRTELNSQHILGRIPPIQFIRDTVLYNNIEIDKRLKIADFGPDETTEDLVKSDSEDDLSESDDSPDIKFGFPDNVIKIRQNVLGVDREKIMKIVMKKRIESKGLHRLAEDPIPSSHTSLQAGDVQPYLPNFPTHSRTHEIKKWAAQFKKERKSLSKKQKYEELRDLMPAFEDKQEEYLDTDFEIENDFDDENLYEDNYDLDNR